MSTPISEVVTVSISLNAAQISRPSFGIPMIAAYHTKNLDRVRTYNSTAGLISDGFAATDPVYLAASKILSQNPSVTSFKVGRRALPPTQKINFIPTDTTVGLVYTINFTTPGGAAKVATYTVAPSDTVALIIAGLITSITGLSMAATTTNNTTSFDFTASAAGALFDVSTTSPLTIKNTTTDPGIATDLAAIALADNSWYGLCLDSNSAAEIAAAAAWVESNGKTFIADTIDTACGTSATTDIMSTIQTASYKRTAVVFAQNLLSYAGAAALGNQLPTDPGRSQLAYKTLSGVTVPNLNTTQRGFIKGKNGNFLTTMAGVNILLYGTCGSGFFDNIRLIDSIQADIQTNIFTLLVNNPKLPFTNASIDTVKAAVLAAITNYIPYGIAPTPYPTVTAPDVSTISATDKGNRNLPGVVATATLAGGIITLQITGNISI